MKMEGLQLKLLAKKDHLGTHEFGKEIQESRLGLSRDTADLKLTGRMFFLECDSTW